MLQSFNRSHLMALGLFVALVVWMLAGPSFSEETTDRALAQETGLFKVRYKMMTSEPYENTVRASGFIAANRNIDVVAEINGKITRLIAPRGSRVNKGDHLLDIDVRNLPEREAQAKALVAQRQLEVEGAERLVEKGVATEASVTIAKGELAAAKANLTDIQLRLNSARVKAPFSGWLDQRYVELGQYVREGDPLVRVIDTSPLKVKGRVSEKNIAGIQVGAPAFATMRDDTPIHGEITFIAQAANPQTRSYDIEMTITDMPKDVTLFDGQTATLVIPQGNIKAYFISPALLIISPSGELGLKTLSVDNTVDVTPVELLSAEDDGVWVSADRSLIRLITVGQGFVKEGDKVDVVEDQALDQKRSKDTPTAESDNSLDQPSLDQPLAI